MLNKAEAHEDLTSVPIGRGPTKVSHLFFADDSLLFCQASPSELSKILAILNHDENASGQVINKENPPFSSVRIQPEIHKWNFSSLQT